MSKETLVKFRDFATVNPGQSPKSEFYSDTEGLPFLQGNRTFGLLYPKIDTYTTKTTKIAGEGEILMSVRAPVGDLNFAKEKICIGRGLAGINAKDGNNKFLFYCLKYNIQNLIRQSGGTTYDSVNKDIINDFDLIMPQTPQERIVVAKILSDLDTKIELNNKINAELEAMSKLIYDYWFVQFDFPDKNGNPYKSSGGKMVYKKELKREIPDGWEIKELGKEIEIERGISYKSSEIKGGGIPMINLNSFNLDGTYKKSGIKMYSGKYKDYKLAKCGDLLISVTDVTRDAVIIGKPILVPEYYSELVYSMDVTKVIPSENLSNTYLMMLFNTDHYHDYIKWFASGTTVLHLNMDGMKWYKAEIPPKKLLDKYDSFYESIAKRISETTKQNQKLAKLRDWLLPMLMNGQVKVN